VLSSVLPGEAVKKARSAGLMKLNVWWLAETGAGTVIPLGGWKLIGPPLTCPLNGAVVLGKVRGDRLGQAGDLSDPEFSPVMNVPEVVLVFSA